MVLEAEWCVFSGTSMAPVTTAGYYMLDREEIQGPLCWETEGTPAGPWRMMGEITTPHKGIGRESLSVQAEVGLGWSKGLKQA